MYVDRSGIAHLVTLVWNDLMFSVRFHHRRCVRRRRRKDFYLLRQNCLCQIWPIWDKEYIDLGKFTGWPFLDLALGHGGGID